MGHLNSQSFRQITFTFLSDLKRWKEGKFFSTVLQIFSLLLFPLAVNFRAFKAYWDPLQFTVKLFSI